MNLIPGDTDGGGSGLLMPGRSVSGVKSVSVALPPSASADDLSGGRSTSGGRAGGRRHKPLRPTSMSSAHIKGQSREDLERAVSSDSA